MAAGIDPIYPSAPFSTGVQFAIGDTTTKKIILTAGTNGALVSGIFISTNDTAEVDLQFYIGDGTTDHYIGVVKVVAGSGYTTVARTDALLTLLPTYLRAIPLTGGYTLKAACLATMTTAKVTDVVALGGMY